MQASFDAYYEEVRYWEAAFYLLNVATLSVLLAIFFNGVRQMGVLASKRESGINGSRDSELLKLLCLRS